MQNDTPQFKTSISIQTKLLIYFLIISLIPLLILGLVSIGFFTTPLKQYALIPVNNHLISIANHIRQELYDVREDALYASRLPDLARLLQFEKDATPTEILKMQQELVNDFIELVNKRKKYLYISYINEDGKEEVRVNFIKPDQWKVILGGQLQDKNEKPFFHEARNLIYGSVYVSRVQLNEEYGVLQQPYEEVIYISTPVEDIARNKRGVVTIALMTNVLFTPVQDWQISEYPQSQCFITNNKGFYISHSDQAKEWGEQHTRELKWSLFNDFPSDVSDAILHKDNQPITETEDTIFIKQRMYPGFINADNYWILVSSVPRAEVYAQINHFKMLFVILLIIAFAGTIAFAMILSSQFTRPIKLLRGGAAIIREGDLSHRIKVTSGDEIGELAYDFNLMTAQLQELYQNLEKKVKERTEQLNQAMKDLENKDKQLQKADQLKLDFLTNLSSELRTPLTSVMGYLALLMNKMYGDLNDKQIASLKKARKNLYQTFKWLDGIIRISSLSAVQTDTVTINKQKLDLNSSLEKALKGLQYALEEKKINCVKKYAENKPNSIYSDPEYIDEIVSSVLNGVIHYPDTANISLDLDIMHEPDQLNIVIDMTFPSKVDVDGFYRALIEPFIHSHTYFNITNLSTNVARSLLLFVNGSLDIKYNKDNNEVILKIHFPVNEVSDES